MIPLAIFVIAFASRVIPGPRTIDDAFITFRYARNIVAGEGFVYNPGEQVLGTTTPLYALILAGIASFSGGEAAPFPEIAMLLNAIADGISCILLFLIGRRLGAQYAAIGAALIWAIAPFSVTFAIGGLETSLFVLLLTATALAYLDRRYPAAAFFAALALLTRPDALLLLIPLGLDRLVSAYRKTAGRIGASEVISFLVPVLIWGIFATAYFGTPVSHSLTAKTVAYRLPETAALVRFIQHYATPFLEHLTFGTGWIKVGLVLFPFLSLVGLWKATRSNPRSWPLLAYPWLYLLAFSIANPLIFRWYLTPPLPFYILGILIGVESGLKDLFQRLPETGPRATISARKSLSTGILLLATILIPLSLSLRDWSTSPDHGLQRPAPDMSWYQLELFYREAADFLDPYLEENSVLAASDVGVLGYFTSTPILDTVGLNSPIALDYYPINPDLYVINLATSPDLILDTRPDFIVLLEVYGREGVFKDERFQETYTLLNKIPTDIYGSDGMLIYSRNDLGMNSSDISSS